MKVKPLQLLFVLGLAFSVFLVACEKSNPIDPSAAEEAQIDVEAQIASIPDYEAELLSDPVLQEMDEDHEIAILIDGAPGEIESPSSAGRFHDSNGIRHSIFDCLDTLNLTQGQKDSIRAALYRTHQCKKGHILAIRVINHQIIHKTNQQRNVLIRKFVSGQITRAQLIRELNKLNIRTRIALKSNPAKQRHLQELRKCNLKFYRALHHILTPAQWQLFIDCRKAI